MKLSKNTLCYGIIAYSALVLLLEDWPSMSSTVGSASMVFLIKMVVDLLFGLAAAVRIAGPALFADEGTDTVITAEDLKFSDKGLYGAFLANVAVNLCMHAYHAVMYIGSESISASMFVMLDVVVLALTWLLFKHALKAEKKHSAHLRTVA